MQIEFRKFLIQLIKDYSKDHIAQVVNCDGFQVLTPPPDANAFVGTNLPFVLARKLSLEPKRLSKILSEYENDKFILYSAESGFINAIPKRAVLEDFFSNVLKPDFFVFPDMEKVEDKIDSEDIKKLLSSKKTLSNEDRLMYFALCSYPELSVEPYLEGLNGKENIPWLLNRFSKDCCMLMEKTSEVRGFVEQAVQALEGIGRNELILGLESSLNNLDRVFYHQLIAIMSFRNFHSFQRLFGFSLGLVHLFYSYYNMPFFRLAIERDSLGPVRQSTMILARLIDSVARIPAKY